MLSSPYFKKLFLTRSSAKPRLLFAIEEGGVWRIFTLPQLENPYEESTSVAAAEFHVKFSPNYIDIYHDHDHDAMRRNFSCGYAAGLFYIHGTLPYQGRPMICNPITGRYAILPYLYYYSMTPIFFGFDPIEKQYKALATNPFRPARHKFQTIGAGDMTWREVKCSLPHDTHHSKEICIDGVLYYLGDRINFIDDHVVTSEFMIVCFDLRSERFTFIGVEWVGELINYKGKLAMICLGDEYHAMDELHMWVLDDVEKHEWSKYVYTFTDDLLFRGYFCVVGATTSGEVVFSSILNYKPKQEPFYVFYFNPERNTLRRVEIKGLGEAVENSCTVFTFVNHVEDLDVNELLKSVHPPLTKPEYVEESGSESD
ncbi:hypothetical protein CARUB_v10019558mg [Capsella rubella]|uniref:F-box associated beta-propeller type 3 domain-containing protein n=1 Tax=Capsella rubella TaxID=81985 RepID=R0FTF4_9BRAS|nr:hypothetical protein CARUB_v10019558mg [Capsella rubella]